MFIPGKFRSGPSGGLCLGPSLVIYVREEQLNTTVYTDVYARRLLSPVHGCKYNCKTRGMMEIKLLGNKVS